MADAVSGDEIVITDHGGPVARLTALPESRLPLLLDADLTRPPLRDISKLPSPDKGESLSTALSDAREGELY